jgi:GPH family glycoside/pentoside/hexuronide:cation symporter
MLLLLLKVFNCWIHITLVLFIPGKTLYVCICFAFFAFGIGALFTLMMSMTADVCDLDELKSGLEEGIFGAIYWWMVKFGFAIAGGLSGLSCG